MTKAETVLRNNIKRKLQTMGAYVVHVHGDESNASGTPDLLICYRGIFIGLEVKDPHERTPVTELQKLKLLKITEAGGYGFVCKSIDEAVQYLQLALKLEEEK